MKELFYELLSIANIPKLCYKTYFSENQTKEIDRNRQSPFNFHFLSFFFLPRSLILSVHKVIWKRATFWRLGPLFTGSYFSWLLFPPLPSLLWLVLTYYVNNNVTKGHACSLTRYVFSGTGCNKILKHNWWFWKGLVCVDAVLLGEVEPRCIWRVSGLSQSHGWLQVWDFKVVTGAMG